MSRLAGYDYRGLGRLLRGRLEADGRGWRACAAEVGVSATDLSRVCSGQPVSAPKIIALCDWLGLSVRDFYEPPVGDGPCPAAPPSGRNASKLFHGKSTETEGASHG